MKRNRLFAATLLLSSIVGAAGAEAQDRNPTGGVLLPSPSITETRDATAVSVNPANLGLLDAWRFDYVGSWLSEERRHLTGQGHGFFFGFPIRNLSVGLGLEAMTPNADLMEWQGLDDRARFSLALAYDFQRVFSLGAAYRTFWRYDHGDIHTFDLGLTVHPVNYLALSFVVSDINTPAYGYLTEDRTGAIVSRKNDAPRRFNVGLTLRPFGNDRLALGGELRYAYSENDKEHEQRTDALGHLSVMLFDGVTLRGRFGAEGIRSDAGDTGYYMDGALALDLAGFGVASSLHGQVGPNDDGFEGVTWAVGISGDDGPSINLPRAIRAAHYATIDIEDDLGHRELTRLATFFERMTRDPRLDGVLIRPRADTLSLTSARELRERIRRFRENGRQVFCYLTDATGPEYLACAGADQVWVNPAGGIRTAGLSTKRLYFRNLFDKIGVKADIVRIGEYKSAPEMVTRTGPSHPAELQMNRFMDTVYEDIAAALARDRGFESSAAAKEILEQGPFTAKEALARGLIDKLVAADELDDHLKETSGGPYFLDDRYGRAPERHRRYLDAPAVAVVHIDGDIIDGESVDIPILGYKATGAETLTETLRKLKNDGRIRAVVLRINSGGGSALASDIIWREVMDLRESKPVIASLGSVAASGAYYIASAADEIIAEPTTLTGSIGIYYGKADLSGLLDKIGVDVTTFKRGLHADAHSWTRAYTHEERTRLLGQLEQYYDMFKERVVEGRQRGFTVEIVERLARGRIWSGRDAKYHLLVDRLGGYSDALDLAREISGVPRDIKVFEYPVQKRGLLARIVSSMVRAVSEPSPLEALFEISGLRRTVAALVPFAVSSPEAPQARLPYAVLED